MFRLQKRHFPVIISSVFFMVYKIWMATVLLDHRPLPPVNDSFNYLFRIKGVIDGFFHGDMSMVYTYGLAALCHLTDWTAEQVFFAMYFVGPICALGVLLYFIYGFEVRDNWRVAFVIFFFSFYSSIGPHSFTHFVPSTWMILGSLLWWGTVARLSKNTRPRLLIGLGVTILVMPFIHSVGIFILATNLGLTVLIHLFYRKINGLRILLGLCALAGGLLIFSTMGIKYEALPNSLLSKLASIQEHGQTEMGEGSLWLMDLRKSMNTTTVTNLPAAYAVLLDQAVQGVWYERIYYSFFIFFFPNWYLGLFVAALLASSFAISWRKQKDFWRNPFFYVPLLTYFTLFIVASTYNARGTRLVEVLFPLIFAGLAFMFFDVMRALPRCLRPFSVLGFLVVFGLVNYGLARGENLFLQPLNYLSTAELQKIPKDAAIVFNHGLEESYLLAQGLASTISIFDANAQILVRNHFPTVLYEMKNCPPATQDDRLFNLYRKLIRRGNGMVLPRNPDPRLFFGEELRITPIVNGDCYTLSLLTVPAN